MVPNTGICSGGVVKASLVALHLLGHVAQRVGGALAVELVDGHELGEVEHVDLLQLAGGAELGRHHVHRHVHSGTMAASPWPMPEVSTTTRSKPAALQAAITSGSAWLISLPKSRVARLRMKTRGPFATG
jgi:hypothetical protein